MKRLRDSRTLRIFLAPHTPTQNGSDVLLILISVVVVVIAIAAAVVVDPFAVIELSP